MSEKHETETDPAAAESSPVKLTGKERLELLAAEARPALHTDITKRRILDEWKKADNVVARARQMVIDAIATRDVAAEKVVRMLGRAELRYNDVLYSPSAKGDTIYLRELKKKPHG